MREHIKARISNPYSVYIVVTNTKNIFTMKVIFALAALICIAVAAPAGPEADAVVVKYDADNIGVDGYRYDVETSNGIAQQESGQVKNAGTDNEAIAVQGAYSFTGNDGVRYQVSYIADENGFQPQGAHLPHA